MKFSCTQENFYKGLTIVSQVTSKNINLPILNNTLINIDERTITLSSTNLETAVQTNIRGKVEIAGSYTFPSKLLLDYVALLPKERIDCELISINAGMKISCGTHETKIKGLKADEFPILPVITPKNKYLLPLKDLKSAVEQVIFAVAASQSRPEISGVFMNFKPEKSELILAATDSFRLAETTKSNLQFSGVEGNSSVIVPAKTFHELVRIMSVLKDDSDVSDSNMEIVLGESQIFFSLPQCQLISRLVEGKYPEYTYIIPDNFQTEAVISREELIKLIKTASLFSRTGLYDVTIKFAPGSGNLIVTSADEQRGENLSSMTAEIKGRENSVVLNYKYFLDGLQAIKNEKVVIKMNDTNAPCLLLPFGEETKYRYVIMPIKQ